MENLLTYHPLPRRHRVGFVPETSHSYPGLTEPGLVSPLDKILRAQKQGLPVPFSAGVYLGDDYSILDGKDSFELFEFRKNLEDEIAERKKEFHAATKLLAEMESKASQGTKTPSPDPEPVKTSKVAPEAPKEADSSHKST